MGREFINQEEFTKEINELKEYINSKELRTIEIQVMLNVILTYLTTNTAADLMGFKVTKEGYKKESQKP